MMSSRATLWIRRLSVAVLLAASAYCALWVFSSLDLAFLDCNGSFSLFASTFTCRQPYVAAIGCLFFALSAVGLLLALRRKRTHLSAGSESRR